MLFRSLLSDLRKALLYQYRVRIAYSKSGREPAQYDIDPYTIVLAKGGLYLLAYAHNRDAVRIFALERISAITVTRQRFEMPDEFEPEACFSDAFGLVTDSPMRIKVRFDRELAHMVKDRIWKSGQKLSVAHDGSILLEFEASGSMEIMAWILSYGRHAELLEPPELRKEMRRQAKALREIYRKKDTE